MRCPFCGCDDTQVKDSRSSDDGGSIRRRRVCPKCNQRFTTFERFQQQQVTVTKRDGRRELFEGEKLMRSLLVAVGKRPISREILENIVADTEKMFVEKNISETNSNQIGDFVLQKLKEIDFVGYIRYASVYNAFNNADDFKKLMENTNK